MGLFQLGSFNLAGGEESRWKIECDTLSDSDWETLAYIAVSDLGLPKFRWVEGVPTGGMKFAAALAKHASPDQGMMLLIADDVLTTGKSMEKQRNTRAMTIGVVAFCRGGECPAWITPIFRL